MFYIKMKNNHCVKIFFLCNYKKIRTDSKVKVENIFTYWKLAINLMKTDLYHIIIKGKICPWCINSLAISVLWTLALIFKNTYFFPICVSNSDRTIYERKTKNKDLKMFHSSSIRQQVCFCPKETEASSLSTKGRWILCLTYTVSFVLEPNSDPSPLLRAVISVLCYMVMQCSDSLRDTEGYMAALSLY